MMVPFWILISGALMCDLLVLLDRSGSPRRLARLLAGGLILATLAMLLMSIFDLAVAPR